jgi:hypothetical protein
MRIAQLSFAGAAAALLAIALWGVSSALADRGAGVCLSSSSSADPRAVRKPCVSELLTADATEQQRQVLHLRGYCQGERNTAMMTSRSQIAKAAPEQAGPTCATVIGS